MIDIDVVGAQELKTLFQSFDNRRLWIWLIGTRQSLLGRYYDPIARDIGDRFANNIFGAVILRSIEKVDTEIERLFDQPHRVLFRTGITAHAEAARTTAAQSSDAHLQSRFTKCGVVHLSFSIRPKVERSRLADSPASRKG